MTEHDSAETTRRRAIQALAAAGAIGTIPGGAAAQELTSTETTTEPEDQIAQQIDQTTHIRSYEFADGIFSIEVESDSPTVLKITDSAAVMSAWSGGSSGGGATSIPTEGYTVGSGTTTIQFDASTFEGAAAVTIATSDGTAFVFSEAIERGRPSVAFGTASAMVVGAAVGGSGYGLHRAKQKAAEDDDDPEVWRLK